MKRLPPTFYTGSLIDRQPRRLREHLRAKEAARIAETAAYPWACEQCGRMFLPHRRPELGARLHGTEFETSCDGCKAGNLLNMILGDNYAKEFFGDTP